MNFRVSPMTIEQLESCVDVFIAALPGTESRAEWSRQDALVRLNELWSEPRRFGLIAHDEGGAAPVGFVLGNYVQVAEGTSLRIGELCVHPSRQGFGLGSRLLLGMQQLAQEAGAVSVYLIAEPTTREFCERLGYQAQEEWIVMGMRLDDPGQGTSELSRKA
jgi:predicted N-acetyltransferase YhbS